MPCLAVLVSHALSESFALAAVAIGRVLKGESLTKALADIHAGGPLRAAVQAIAFATLRDYGHAEAMLDRLVARSPSPSLKGLLLAAIVELERGPQAAHAVVHQAVEAAARVAPRSGNSSRGLVNGVLRNFLRQGDSLRQQALATECGRLRHPQWWIDRVRTAWPQHWQAVLEAGNVEPGMTLRVNRRRVSGAHYMDLCREQFIACELLAEQTVGLDKPCAVERLPGFGDGLVSVQDWAAQQAAALLDVRTGMRVLDACAAPGGKTAHIAELADCDLTAIDISEDRLARVRDNLGRLQLSAHVLACDALSPDADNPGSDFERILLDAPCSASGVVRRHPDIKWLRRESDLARLRQTQSTMLRALWKRLVPGGRLLYATCSVFPEENARQIETFLADQDDALPLPISGIADNIAVEAEAGSGWRFGRQILPGHNWDGFFYALLEKKRQ